MCLCQITLLTLKPFIDRMLIHFLLCLSFFHPQRPFLKQFRSLNHNRKVEEACDNPHIVALLCFLAILCLACHQETGGQVSDAQCTAHFGCTVSLLLLLLMMLLVVVGKVTAERAKWCPWYCGHPKQKKYSIQSFIDSLN